MIPIDIETHVKRVEYLRNALKRHLEYILIQSACQSDIATYIIVRTIALQQLIQVNVLLRRMQRESLGCHLG